MTLIVALSMMTGCGFELSSAAPDARGPDASGDGASTAGDAASMPDSAGACITTTLSASKSYSPSVWVVGELVPMTPYLALEIPAKLVVTAGNAGNHCASLTFKIADNRLARCRYRGGSSVSSPTTSANAAEIQSGLTYVFDGCTEGAACPSANGTMFPFRDGDQVGLATDQTPITLRLDHGDTAAGSTVVDQPLRRCEVQ